MIKEKIRQAQEDEDSMWSFPVANKMMDRGTPLLDSFTESMGFSQDLESIVPLAPGQTDSEDDQNVSDRVEEIQDRLTEITAGKTATVNMDENTFIPKRKKVDTGTTVEFTNNDDVPHVIKSSSGESINSGEISPGESFTHVFEESGVTMIFDSLLGEEEMCGAIIVGDATLNQPLPCEANPDRKLAKDDTEKTGDNQSGNSSGAPSMSKAAEERKKRKENAV